MNLWPLHLSERFVWPMACAHRGANAGVIARRLSQVSVRCSTSAASINRAASRSLVAQRQRLFVLSAFALFCVRARGHLWRPGLGRRVNPASVCTLGVFALWFIFNLSFHLPQPPPLPLLYLFLTESSGGVDVVAFQVLSGCRFSFKVASREQLAESGPRWPPSLRPPPFRTGLCPRKPLARR